MLRDPNEDYTAEYWDDYLKEFGPSAYVAARYGVSDEVG